LGPQGTLYSLKRQREFIVKLGKHREGTIKILECRIKSTKCVIIENMLGKKSPNENIAVMAIIA
jgi:hypothetical protein